MKKHILFIVENNAAPHDVRVWPEALVARNNGFDVSVISPKNETAPGKYAKIEGIEIYRHYKPEKNRGIISFISECVIALTLEFLLSLKIYIRKPFHSIHAANPPDTIFIIALFYKLFGVKFIFDHHDLAPELYRAKFSNYIKIVHNILILCEKLSCKVADVVISTNLSYKKIVKRRHSLNSEKIFVVRNDPPRDAYFCEINNNSKKANEKKVLLFIGCINSQDGVDVLLQSLNHLVYDLKENNFICNIIGDGDSLPLAKQLTKRLNLEDFVDFKGYVFNKEEKKEYFFKADICVEPAPFNEINNHSTFIKIMEYMAAGKPIVAFDFVETRYSTNRSALLVKPGDIFGFAKAIKHLINNPILRKNLGKHGRERIKTELNWEITSKNLVRAFETLYI